MRIGVKFPYCEFLDDGFTGTRETRIQVRGSNRNLGTYHNFNWSSDCSSPFGFELVYRDVSTDAIIAKPSSVIAEIMSTGSNPYLSPLYGAQLSDAGTSHKLCYKESVTSTLSSATIS